MTSKKRAVVLLSGGLDSTTTLAIAKKEPFQVYALSFDYGQKNRFEVIGASRIAKYFEVLEHKVMHIDLTCFGGSSLTSSLAVEKGRNLEQIGSGIPLTYVPARNTLFLSYALAWAEVLGVSDIFIGVNAVDWSGYPDCRSEFIESFENTANLGTRIGTTGETRLKIHTPLINMSKSEIIASGLALGVDYSMTSTCYDPAKDGAACGACDSCTLRIAGFNSLGLKDPILYDHASQQVST